MDNRSGILDSDGVGNVEGVVTTRATFTEAELARAIRAADKRRTVMGTNEEVTVANAADPVGKSARK